MTPLRIVTAPHVRQLDTVLGRLKLLSDPASQRVFDALVGTVVARAP